MGGYALLVSDDDNYVLTKRKKYVSVTAPLMTLPISIKKTISFPRLSSKNVLSYEVYAKFIDDTYDSGIRIELIDTILNTNIPNPVLNKIELEYSNNFTWSLPKDIYIDRDHNITVLVDDIQISKLYYTVNKIAKLFTINTNKITINPDSKISIIYYKDVIEKSYMLDDDCEIYVKPVIIDSYHYGQHNIIL